MVGVLNAQVPQAFNYQGMAVDANGDPLVNATIGLQFSIIENSINGNVLYTENGTTNTTAIGHFAFDVGTGSVVSGNFSNADWGSDAHFLKVEMDANGGTNYTYNSTVELLSVPFALVVESSGNNPVGQVGLPGPTGAAGAQGVEGPAGPTGAAGTVSGIQCWDLNENGIGDSAEDFNGDGVVNDSDCGGPEGPPGPPGAQGPQGATGPAGPSGGEKGDPGPKGPIGPKGPDAGSPGPAGPIGDAGPAGVNGPKGADGPKGPTGDPSNEVGPEGPEGPPGPGGGPKGPNGASGASGPPGPIGPQGASGAQGPAFIDYSKPQGNAPSPSSSLNIYVDDGTNRADGLPGFRYWNGGNWIDL